ncbi:hypothetical protein B4U84_29315 [Westiellopsis prolifica IICB1]|nr:hypothetical protein B4U84_29315 [Westiellopsis prolifica IICB1]
MAWLRLWGRPQKKDTSRVPSFIRCAARDLDVTAGIFFQGKCLGTFLSAAKLNFGDSLVKLSVKIPMSELRPLTVNK